MLKLYLLILFIISIINGCSSVDYTRNRQTEARPPVVEQSREQAREQVLEHGVEQNTTGTYQAKVITNAAVSQTQVASRSISKPPASRGAVLDLLKQSKTAIDEGNYSDAESLLKRALRIEPGNAWLWHNMAVLQFYREDYQQAIQQALKSNNLAKNNQKLKSDNYKVIKQSYIELGDPEKASRYK